MSRHRTDWASLIAGSLFVGLGLAFVLSGATDWDVPALWVLLVLAVGLGVVTVLRLRARSRSRSSASHRG